ncbi:zf-C3HC-domain-containing protein [Cylindrobasidium torrendii FP15055 ss-10]|uniref:Zf-C3HC-domain-containing protein n=1 Tax=Cylindrobasidium torrendii FP15055 ss-10 TaxID=1314674 RepID=A0A0D7B7S3_9AGAR|nr:zf-C3HC-domain-containing protein [Cylindrobasidium torrendii FP15055 ss-10]
MSSEANTSSIPIIRATKRKLDDAFQTLDDATHNEVSPPPLKKSNTARSLYSTLSKYGIKSNKEPKDPYAKKTPHLSAILSRAATRTRKAFPFKFSEPAPISVTSTADYRPSSISSFLSRLSTFKLSTYANKPVVLDAVAASKCGWTNEGKDRLVCGICNASWVVAGKEGLNRDGANTLVEKQRKQLVSAHKDGCPWQTRQCDDAIYRIPLQSSTSTLRDILSTAALLSPLLVDVEVQHPMTSAQLSSLHSTVKSYTAAAHAEGAPPLSNPSEKAILTALFGWTLAPTMGPPTSSSWSASVSQAGTAPGTPTRSRAPTPSPQPSPAHLTVPTTPSASSKQQDALLHCTLCQRRIGLWAYAPRNESSISSRTGSRRSFDLLKQHRAYCPYVVRSTIIPTFSMASPRPSTSSVASVNGNGELEGWRAVLTVLLRYGMSQKSNITSRPVSERQEVEEERPQEMMDVDGGVSAMVEGVKARGGKDLLRYVKGLIG